MSSLIKPGNRPDDFEARREHLRGLTDEELHSRFWHLVEEIVEPLVAEARSHTSPAIERSVLLRMGFSSIDAHDLVEKIAAAGLLGHGAGKLVLDFAQSHDLTIGEAGDVLLLGFHWKEFAP